MCGIIGYVGQENALSIVKKGLSRLEYRGYDSAGIAYRSSVNAEITLKKAVGQVNNLFNLMSNDDSAFLAMGHTRWATHGAPTKANAHPQEYKSIYVIHNGIIENHLAIKQRLLDLGHVFKSETDTEVVAHILWEEMKDGKPMIEALRKSLDILRGSYGLGIIHAEDYSRIWFAKKNSPLLVARDDKGTYIASDQTALVDFCPRVHEILDGDIGFIAASEVGVFDLYGPKKTITYSPLTAELSACEKGGFKHFMHKEIFEQPLSLKNTLRERIVDDKIDLSGFGIAFDRLKQIHRIHIVACGSAFYAGLCAKIEMEALLKIPVEVEIASEYRYRDVIIDNRTLVIAISQSGETADTLAAVEKALSENALVMSICNVVGSAIWRKCAQSIGNMRLNAGPEISVASTKAFTSQVLAIKLLALGVLKDRGALNEQDEAKKVNELLTLPKLVEETLQNDGVVRDIAKYFVDSNKMLYIARGNLFPIAFEGALKMKELAYISSEGYPAGELKHGPIATVDTAMPVVVLYGNDNLLLKTESNASEVKARGARVISFAPQNFFDALQSQSEYFVGYPEAPRALCPLLASVLVQLFAYHVCDLKGLDVDKPRNLAKSVTVE